MKSALSRLTAETIMQQPETMALSHIQPKVWILYVDNTLVIIKKEQQEKTFETINIFTEIKVTREEENKILSFLNIQQRKQQQNRNVSL